MSPGEGRRGLRLLAEDDDDLQVVSAALQDALTTLEDIVFEAAPRRLTIALDRFCWENAEEESVRLRAGLQFGGVLQVRSRGLPLEARSSPQAMLALTFEPSGEAENPGGSIVIHFAGGGDLQALVECVDVVLTDLSEPWPAPAAPDHKV